MPNPNPTTADLERKVDFEKRKELVNKQIEKILVGNNVGIQLLINWGQAGAEPFLNLVDIKKYPTDEVAADPKPETNVKEPKTTKAAKGKK